MKRTKFYVCPHCGNIIQGAGDCQIVCCGNALAPAKVNQADDAHTIRVSEIEDDFYVEIDHEMRKTHFIRFVAYVGMDRVLTMRLYPEQDGAVRFPRMYGGKLYVYCNTHGLFAYEL